MALGDDLDAFIDETNLSAAAKSLTEKTASLFARNEICMPGSSLNPVTPVANGRAVILG
jgi:hypothetical protein